MTFSQTSQFRIAVAEDDAAVRQTFVHLLEAMGHQVVCVAADGEQLVSACVPGEVDLVFTDFHLPLMDGLEAAEHIAGKGIPVVLISGHPDAEQIVVDFEPVAMMIRKPATIEKVRAAIEQIMCGS
jgi:CheY-like chemotaxis protein